MKRNWLKRYDKLGLLLRVETVSNQPGEFNVLRECQHRDGTTSLGWFALCKGVGNIHHYKSHALACNHRYLSTFALLTEQKVRQSADISCLKKQGVLHILK
jgi:hypothetical protein